MANEKGVKISRRLFLGGAAASAGLKIVPGSVAPPVAEASAKEVSSATWTTALYREAKQFNAAYSKLIQDPAMGDLSLESMNTQQIVGAIGSQLQNTLPPLLRNIRKLIDLKEEVMPFDPVERVRIASPEIYCALRQTLQAMRWSRNRFRLAQQKFLTQ